MAIYQRIFYEIITLGVLCIILCQAEAPSQRIRFPGPVQIKELPTSILGRQNNFAPYPAAGFRPDPPFELPTVEDSSFQPDSTYGPPDLTYGPPEPTNAVPADTYGPPTLTFELPEQTYGPPENEFSSQTSAAFTDATFFFPTTQLTLPNVERVVAFRPRRRRPANIRRRKLSRLPVKSLVSIGTPPVQGFAQLPPKIFN